MIDTEGLGDEDLRRLRGTHELLRSVPGPPAEVPPALEEAVGRLTRPRESLWTRRRALVAVALAAALSALFFGLGTRVGAGGDFEERAAFEMRSTDDAPGASAVVRLGERDADGNWPLRLEVEGLPALPEGGYYVLWLASDGEYGATCGSFSVGDGETEAEWTVSYPLRDFDQWVVTARLPGEEPDAAPWLLQADVAL